MLISWPIDNGHLRVKRDKRRELVLWGGSSFVDAVRPTMCNVQSTMFNAQCQMLGGQQDPSWEAPTGANLIPAEVTRLLRKLACAATVSNAHCTILSGWPQVNRNTPDDTAGLVGTQQSSRKHWHINWKMQIYHTWLTDTEMIRWFGDQISQASTSPDFPIAEINIVGNGIRGVLLQDKSMMIISLVMGEYASYGMQWKCHLQIFHLNLCLQVCKFVRSDLSVEFNAGSLNLNQWKMERGGGVVRWEMILTMTMTNSYLIFIIFYLQADSTAIHTLKGHWYCTTNLI